MSKWSIITGDGEYRPVSPECDVEEIKAGIFRPRLIRRLVVHALDCEHSDANPCGRSYGSPAEAHNAVSAYHRPPPAGPWCTCKSHWENHGPGYTEPISVEPDFYCAFHFPENHRRRALTAAGGYTRKVSEELQDFGSVPTWQQLPEAGKHLWRAWAECELWAEDLDILPAAGAPSTAPW